MRIAVTYDSGNIFEHFGRTEQFKIYDAADGEIKSTAVIGTGGNGHGMLADFLKRENVDALICGGIGDGAKSMLAAAGIKLFGGVSGNADEAATALIAGRLVHQPDVKCSHHGEHEHGEHNHSCGGHSH